MMWNGPFWLCGRLGLALALPFSHPAFVLRGSYCVAVLVVRSLAGWGRRSMGSNDGLPAVMCWRNDTRVVKSIAMNIDRRGKTSLAVG